MSVENKPPIGRNFADKVYRERIKFFQNNFFYAHIHHIYN